MSRAAAATRGASGPPIAFLLVFAGLFTVLYLAYIAIPDDVLRRVVYPDGLGRPVAMVINRLLPAEHVRVDGNSLTSAGTSLHIVRGCDGVGVLFLLVAAIAASPASIRARLLGALAACAFVYVLNEGRLVLLYLVAAHRAPWFTAVHVYVLPTALIAACGAFFVMWLANADTKWPP